ncbi:MAG: GIY-YIG nuclease family protein [Chitinispirillaceae bacterium]
MHEEIISYLRKNSQGISSESIAEIFLKFKAPDKKLAHVAVEAILSKDNRIFFKEGLWHARPLSLSQNQHSIKTIPWTAVYFLTDSSKRILHISLWNPFPSLKCLLSAWLCNPDKLSVEDSELLKDFHDRPFEENVSEELFEQIVSELQMRVPLFFSHEQYSLFSYHALETGISIDSYFLMSQLFKAANLPSPRPLVLENAARSVLNIQKNPDTGYRRGELFCSIVTELFEKMKEKGIETYEQLEKTLQQESRPVFAGKEFSSQTIERLPEKPGVYGFTNETGGYIYIGKSNNVRKRIQSYFRFNEESPVKLKKLRDQAHSLTVHLCGSELESLLLEYRLIRKHKPILNSQIQISERRGNYELLDDTVLLLPHAEEGKGISIWIRKECKIRLRPFFTDWHEEKELTGELEEYFHSESLPASREDFPELEITTRWVKRNRDRLCVIQAENLATAQEIFEVMKSCWRDFQP